MSAATESGSAMFHNVDFVRGRKRVSLEMGEQDGIRVSIRIA